MRKAALSSIKTKIYTFEKEGVYKTIVEIINLRCHK